jgi:hypothetical protein
LQPIDLREPGRRNGLHIATARRLSGTVRGVPCQVRSPIVAVAVPGRLLNTRTAPTFSPAR